MAQTPAGCHGEDAFSTLWPSLTLFLGPSGNIPRAMIHAAMSSSWAKARNAHLCILGHGNVDQRLGSRMHNVQQLHDGCTII